LATKPLWKKGAQKKKKKKNVRQSETREDVPFIFFDRWILLAAFRPFYDLAHPLMACDSPRQTSHISHARWPGAQVKGKGAARREKMPAR